MRATVLSVLASIFLLCVSGAARADEVAFFRIVSPIDSGIQAFGYDGMLVWTNATTTGVTCMVQRATKLGGASNWVDYIQHAATGCVVSLKVYDLSTPAGMALIPAGSFLMGDNFGDDFDPPREQPIHAVYVSAFYMSRTEVTKAKWDEVAAWAVTNGYDISVESALGKLSTHPAHSMNWYTCMKWCNAWSQKEHLTPCYTVDGETFKTGESDPDCNWEANGYRLPTEAEWEKAARGGFVGKRFPWGNTITHSQANYYSCDSYDYDISPTRGYNPTYNDGVVPYTSPVGSFMANGYGLYDMAGNLWEMCWDLFSYEYYSDSPTSDPHGPSSGSARVGRGGSWLDGGAYFSRVADRAYGASWSGGNYLGFRPARKAP